MNPTQAAMQLQGSYERSTMTMTPPTPLKNYKKLKKMEEKR